MSPVSISFPCFKKRNLLYWNPDVTTTAAGSQTLEFYADDQSGTYVVVAQGISPNGLSGTVRFTF